MGREFSLSVDAKGLVKAFEGAPDKTKEMVRLQMKIAVERIRDYGSKHHRYTTRTGNLERNGINTKTEDAAGYLWLDNERVPYARAIHEGRGPFEIVPRNKKVLRWAAGGGFTFAKRVQHPGIKPDPFLYEAAEHELPGIEQDFAKALQNLLEEL